MDVDEQPVEYDKKKQTSACIQRVFRGVDEITDIPFSVVERYLPAVIEEDSEDDGIAFPVQNRATGMSSSSHEPC